jgi:hypothetical protein
MWPDFLAGWIRLRTQWRGFELPLLASPLLPAAFIGTLAGEQRIVVGCLLGFGASLLAGFVWDQWGASPALMLGSGFAVVALLGLSIVSRNARSVAAS